MQKPTDDDIRAALLEGSERIARVERFLKARGQSLEGNPLARTLFRILPPASSDQSEKPGDSVPKPETPSPDAP
jgi:hypothetical protein